MTGPTETSQFQRTDVFESAGRLPRGYFQSRSQLVVATAYFVLSVLGCGKLQMKGVEVSALPSYEGAKRLLPSTSEVSRVTLAALRLPAGRLSPIFSSLSLKHRPPFFDFALKRKEEKQPGCN